MFLHNSSLKSDIHPYGETFVLLQKKPNDSINHAAGYLKPTKQESNKM